MGIRFSKRVNLGKGLGFNISKSGITPSLRTKSGSISIKGFSIKTGVPGVSYRNNFSKSTRGCLGLCLIFFAGIVLIIKNL